MLVYEAINHQKNNHYNPKVVDFLLYSELKEELERLEATKAPLGSGKPVAASFRPGTGEALPVK